VFSCRDYYEQKEDIDAISVAAMTPQPKSMLSWLLWIEELRLVTRTR